MIIEFNVIINLQLDVKQELIVKNHLENMVEKNNYCE